MYPTLPGILALSFSVFFFSARILRWISDSGCTYLTDEETVCYSTAQGCREILHRSPACLLNWFRSFVKMHELSFFAVTWKKQSVILQMMCPLKFYQATDDFACMLCILCTINGWFWHFIIYKKRNKICVYSINVFFFSKTGYKMLILSKGGIKYIWRYHLDVPWQENLRKKHCDYNVDILIKQQKKLNVCYIIIKKMPRIFTTASSWLNLVI